LYGSLPEKRGPKYRKVKDIIREAEAKKEEAKTIKKAMEKVGAVVKKNYGPTKGPR
jgi:hypothetical protein